MCKSEIELSSARDTDKPFWDEYFERKKRQGLIFTLHNIDPSLPYESINKKTGRPIEAPGDASWWSHLSSRFRDSHEQAAFLAAGCTDKKLPRKEI